MPSPVQTSGRSWLPIPASWHPATPPAAENDQRHKWTTWISHIPHPLSHAGLHCFLHRDSWRGHNSTSCPTPAWALGTTWSPPRIQPFVQGSALLHPTGLGRWHLHPLILTKQHVRPDSLQAVSFFPLLLRDSLCFHLHPVLVDSPHSFIHYPNHFPTPAIQMD